MKIILSTNFSPWSLYNGGGQRSVHNIATHLTNIGIDTHVIYTKSPFENISPTEPTNYNLHWATLPAISSNRKALFRNASAYSVSNVVEKLADRDTIVHSNGEESSLLGSLRKKIRFGFICTPRYPSYPDITLPNLEKTPTFSTLLLQNKYQTLAYSLHHSDLVTPTSSFAASMIQKTFGIDQSKITIVPNGISKDLFNDKKRSPISGKIFFFGRLETSKGIDLLLNVFSSLPSYTTLTVAGNGEYYPTFKKQLDRLQIADRVTYHPWLSHQQIALQIAESSIVCLPSLEESFGNAMAEAMAAGAPIISTTAGSIPELITNNHDGILISPNSESELKSQLILMLKTPSEAEKLGLHAKETSKKYAWSNIADKWVNIYQNTLANIYSQ